MPAIARHTSRARLRRALQNGVIQEASAQQASQAGRGPACFSGRSKSVEACAPLPCPRQHPLLQRAKPAIQPGMEDAIVVGEPVLQRAAEAALELIDAVA